MPFTLPTIPFQPAPDMWGATPIARSPSATNFGGVIRLDADITAIPPGGHIATLVSMGFDAGFAPQQRHVLTASVNALDAEAGLAEAFLAWSHAFAGLRIFIEEFSPALAFLRGIPGPLTTALDLSATFLGISATGVGQRRRITASLIVPAVPGNFYRVWVDSVQSADCFAVTGPAAAISNISFDFGPVFFDFT